MRRPLAESFIALDACDSESLLCIPLSNLLDSNGLYAYCVCGCHGSVQSHFSDRSSTNRFETEVEPACAWAVDPADARCGRRADDVYWRRINFADFDPDHLFQFHALDFRRPGRFVDSQSQDHSQWRDVGWRILWRLLESADCGILSPGAEWRADAGVAGECGRWH